MHCRQVARPVSRAMFNTKELLGLVDLMKETMRSAPGVGLAAPQIGIPLRVRTLQDLPKLCQPTAQRACSPDSSASVQCNSQSVCVMETCAPMLLLPLLLYAVQYNRHNNHRS